MQIEHADIDVELNSEAPDHGSNFDTGVASQTDITMEELTLKFDQLSFASKTIERLEKKIDTSPFGLRDDPSNDIKWIYYTGFSYTFVEGILYKIIEDDIPTTSITALSSFNLLILTLIKLRLNLHFRDLAFHFKISRSTASTYFEKVIDILHKTLQQLIIWPERSVASKNIPSCFQEAFQDKTTIILDCFEVFIEKPASLKTQMQCWSHYKHHNTVKFLIGITPQGTVSYISKAWGGRTSDKQIVENSGFLNHIPGDIVLADRGFLIKETLGVLQSKLVIPAFTKGKKQLHPLDIEATRHIAHVRIHVERTIGMLKNKFNIFKDTIPISMIKKENDPDDLNIGANRQQTNMASVGKRHIGSRDLECPIGLWSLESSDRLMGLDK